MNPRNAAGPYADAHTVLKNIRTIKLLGWEAEQAQRVEAARESELYQARQIAYKQIQMELVK